MHTSGNGVISGTSTAFPEIDKKMYLGYLITLKYEEIFMGKLKNEMRKIHSKKIRKAKEKLKALEKGSLIYNRLDSTAKKFFYKRLKAGYEFPARLRKTDVRIHQGQETLPK